ncbi:MAG: ribonuclease R [Candidatus Taylorbacteria bacterium]|nr:ribonuclease R [Candidatus Taylorbacteria bacterium]
MKKRQKSHGASKAPKVLNGVIRITGKGTGFVIIEDREDDVMIEQEHLNTALNNDEVTCTTLPQKVRGRTMGKVTAVTQRAKKEFVGTIGHENGKLFVTPDDKKVYKDILITEGATPEAKDNIKALVSMRHWTDPKKNPEGRILKLIGKKGVHDVEMRAIVLEKGFDTEYPDDVNKEADAIALHKTISPAEVAKRRDFRQTLTFTIDPIDAKDFDDAISFKKLPNGNFEVGVHIADVSHYVRENSPLDREARKRGFSVYLVDRTIPMLPEALSNIVCSLNPDEDRLTFSAVFEMDTEGAVLNRWFGKTVIHSAKRFTYESAQEVLDGKLMEHAEALKALQTISRKLRDEKLQKGAIDFEQDEVRFELDATGRPIRIYKKERLETHKLVEEFMLLANREVAEHIFKARAKKKSEEPFIYRVHDIPNTERIANLGMFVKALGYTLNIKNDTVSAKDLTALFEKIEGHSDESMIKTAAIRSMAKAIYSTVNIGHYGLSFEYYTHFTSPIRRYADLLVHRMLFHHLNGTTIPPREWHTYEKMARDNSDQEIAAAEAERTSKKLKQVEYMSERIGQTFDGIISGITEWGMYIEEKETRCEGMVKIRDIGDDYFNLEEKTYSLVGEKTKERYTLGDTVRFTVTGGDIERKTLDYALVKDEK